MVDVGLLEAGIAILGIMVPTVAGLLGTKWQLAKRQVKEIHDHSQRVLNTVTVKAQQLDELVTTINKAVEDDKISPAETKAIARTAMVFITNLTGDLKESKNEI